MSIIPDFLMKRVYQKGSLRETTEGIMFELKNILGPGVITGIDYIKINEDVYKPDVIKFFTAGFSSIANQISPENPVSFRLGQEGTLLLEGAEGLKKGLNEIILNIISRDAGSVKVVLTDTV